MNHDRRLWPGAGHQQPVRPAGSTWRASWARPRPGGVGTTVGGTTLRWSSVIGRWSVDGRRTLVALPPPRHDQHRSATGGARCAGVVVPNRTLVEGPAGAL